MHDSLEQFLRAAARLEADAADGYDALAAALDPVAGGEVRALFQRFAEFSRLHLSDVLAIQRRELAREYAVDDDRFDWPEGYSPEDPRAVVELEGITPIQAVCHALEVERRACDFYSHVAGRTRSQQVQELAQEFAEEESGHVDHLERWLENMQCEEPR